MDSASVDALIKSIKNGEYEKTQLLFSQCKMIWPDQISGLMEVVNASNLRVVDYALYKRLRSFAKIYLDAVNGKLQFNDEYINCFKHK